MNPELKALLRRDYLSFARKAILELEGNRIGVEPYLKYLADGLKQFADGETPRLIVNLPPGHLKTWLGSICLAALMLAHDPSLKIMIVTHGEDLSKTIARNIRAILQSDWFRELFATRIKKDHAAITDFGTTTTTKYSCGRQRGRGVQRHIWGEPLWNGGEKIPCYFPC